MAKHKRPKYGDTSLWPAPGGGPVDPPASPQLRDAVFGSQTDTNTTSEVITLPAYEEGDLIIMIVTRNQDAAGFSGDENCSPSEVAMGDGRCSILAPAPINSVTSFTLTADGDPGIWRWWIASFSDVDHSKFASAVSLGDSNTTSAITPPVTTLGFISSGDEIRISAASVNATATWTTDGEVLYSNASGNASLCVRQLGMSSDNTAIADPDFYRGNEGDSRMEASAAIVLPGLAASEPENVNNLNNPSFEAGSTIATSWEPEDSTTDGATFSLTVAGANDGALAQRIEYTGVAGDVAGDKVIQIFQIPSGDTPPGTVVTFDLYVSGTITDAAALIGIEAFDELGGYLSEHDEYFTVPEDPEMFSVEFTCPALTNYVAVYLQINEIGSSTAVDVRIDSARCRLS